MQFNMKIIAISPAELKQGKNGKSYSMIEVTYKDLDKDQTKSKKLMSFDKAIYNVFTDATPGQVFSVTVEKEGEFWNWKSVRSGAQESTQATTTGDNQVATVSYDDRRQLMIVRQSTLNYAVNWCGNKEGLTLADVFNTADLFQKYVFNPNFILEDDGFVLEDDGDVQ